LAKLLVEIKAAPSGSEARRLITQGGVTVDGEKVTDPAFPTDLSTERTLKVGKRFFAKVKKS
jgi:tyrosyl-tRNA synthetase